MRVLAAAGVLSACASASPPPAPVPVVPLGPALAPTASREPLPAPAPPVSAPVAPSAVASSSPAPAATPATEAPQSIEKAVRWLREAGYPETAGVIETRVSQPKPKMKLEPEQGVQVARYVHEALPSMPEARELTHAMPKTVVELVRSTYERGVSTREAESMARYFSHLLDHLKPQNLSALDENCSHVVGRDWHEIDYSGEPLTWEKQKRIYTPKGVPHFKDAATLERFFRVESQAPYFNKLYRPEGSVP
jgi:hypothetical protein